MKPIISRLSGYALLVFFPILLLKKGKFRIIFLVIGLLVLASCFRKFYQTNTVSQVNETVIQGLKNSRKYFILHLPMRVVGLSQITTNQDTLKAIMSPVPVVHSEELDAKSGKENVFKGSSRDAVMSEVHLYSKYADTTLDGKIQLPLNEIYRMDVYSFDQGATTRSTILSIVGITVTVGLVLAGVAGIISANSDYPVNTPAPYPPPPSGGGGATGMSCPIVYVKQDGKLSFNNALYPGSIVSNLERTDYLTLEKLNPENSLVKLRIQSSNKEIQQINMLKLIAVRHNSNRKVLANAKGKIFILGEPDQLVSARVPKGKDLTAVLSKADNKSYDFSIFNPDTTFSHALIKFRKPKSSNTARMVIRARANLWTTQMHQEFANLSGENYPAFRAFREQTDTATMQDWFLKQGFQLRVFIKSGKEWKYIDHFPVPGLEAYRDMVMEVPIPESNDQYVEFKLETALRFWDLDYVGLDSSPGEYYSIQNTESITVMNGNNVDMKDKVNAQDASYAKLNEGEFLDLEFKVPSFTNKEVVDYLLIARGYYHDQLTYPGKPNMEMVNKFYKDGEFDRFSRIKYKEYEDLLSLAKKYGTK